MSTIQRLIIENFQSHEHTVLDFVQGLNVISGPSDHGKSAIIRALKWVLYNEPRGTDFIRHGTSTARVTLEFENGYKIVRERSQNKNRYILIDQDDNEMVFESFGNEIPSEIVKVHGIPKVALDSDLSTSLNIGEQLEGPFMLSETGSVRAKAIGRLIGLHIIDKAIRDSIVDLRRENQTAEKTKVTLHEVELRLEEYKDLENIEKRLKEADIILKKTESCIDRKDKLERLFISLNETQREDESVTETLKRLDGLKESELYLKESQLALNKLDKLEKARKGLFEIEEGLKNSFKVINATNKLDECKEILIVNQERKVRYDKLKSLASIVRSNNEETDVIAKQLDMTGKINEIANLLIDVKLKSDMVQKLSGVLEKLRELNDEQTIALKVLNKTNKLSGCEVLIEEIRKRIDTLKKVDASKEQLETLIDNIKEGNKFFIQNNNEIEKLVDAYSSALKRIGKCPVCNSIISEDKIKDIIKHYEEVH